jgi:hypothetical protein
MIKEGIVQDDAGALTGYLTDINPLVDVPKILRAVFRPFIVLKKNNPKLY